MTISTPAQLRAKANYRRKLASERERMAETIRQAMLALGTIAGGKYVLGVPWEAEVSQGIAAQTLADIAALTQGKGEAK